MIRGIIGEYPVNRYVEILGFDILKIAQSEFGSNRKNRSNRFKTVVQYCLDMEQALESFWRSLERNGLIILVIGRESSVRGVPFYNGLIVKDMIREMRGFRDIKNFERKFTNKFGASIKEDIIVFKKDKLPPDNNCARNVALKHLRIALHQVSSDVKDDITDVIAHIDAIQPSPMFSLKGILNNEDFPIDSEVVCRFVQEMQAFVDAIWYDPEEALRRGSFV